MATNQTAIVRELMNRRDQLDPEKQLIVDELANRMGISSSGTNLTQPDAQGSSIGAGPQGAYQEIRAQETAESEYKRSPGTQFVDYLKGFGTDIQEGLADPRLSGKAKMALSLLERTFRPLDQAFRVMGDPKGEIQSGRAFNLEANRPLENDPLAATALETAGNVGTMFVTGSGLFKLLPKNIQNRIKMLAKIDKPVIEGPQMPTPPKQTMKEAKKAIEDIPQAKADIGSRGTEQKDALDNMMADEMERARQGTSRRFQRETDPRQEAIDRFNAEKRARVEKLEADQVRQTNRDKLNAGQLKEQAAEQVTRTNIRTGEDLADITQGMPTPREKVAFANTSEANQVNTYRMFGAKEKEIHTAIEEIVNRPANISVHTVGKGKKAVEKSVAGNIDLAPMRKTFRGAYDELIADLRIARDNGSAGARAVIKVFEREGPLSFKQALKLRADLNSIGRHGADIGLDADSGLARKLAGELGEVIRTQGRNFPDGGTDLIKLLDDEVVNLSHREALFGSKGSKASRAIMESTGNAATMTNPVDVDAWIKAADDSSIHAARSQVVDDLLSKGPEGFAEKWRSLDDEVKHMWFDEGGRYTKMDEVANASQAKLDSITKQLKAAEEQKLISSIEKSEAFRARKQKISELDDKIKVMEGEIKEAKAFERKSLADKLRALRKQKRLEKQKINRDIRLKKANLDKKMLEAQKRLSLHKRNRKLIKSGIIGASLVGGGSKLYHSYFMF